MTPEQEKSFNQMALFHLSEAASQGGLVKLLEAAGLEEDQIMSIGYSMSELEAKGQEAIEENLKKSKEISELFKRPIR